MPKYDALSLFSGGLDSLLAAKLLQRQGLNVLGLHFTSPFFGCPDNLPHWREVYGLDIEPVDVGQPFVDMLLRGPGYGLGKRLNPCVDCKILMLRHAKELMPRYSAKILATGEVIGQRPMSQRHDALNAISREAGVRDVLLRPLCARNLDPTPVEQAGLVDRDQLLNLGGRGRKGQLALAEELGITEVPTPAGGCRLTEKENCRRYHPLLARHPAPTADDLHLANVGRQYWAGNKWLTIGRNKADNERLLQLARPGDTTITLVGFPSPWALLRPLPGTPLEPSDADDAASLLASFSPKAAKAAQAGEEVRARLETGGQQTEIPVTPARQTPLGWRSPTWEETLEWKKEAYPG
ncbi:tRNA (5-methylaminomethyl-2-thiouridylate)-methyltransferase [Desulfohalovibrio reitneri]|uniref:tRNA (5-methylaminomethyl-2-thiouridylate)-methyltransferase n=1 Tax=Desulfohalovibrio reitneri TaxID=1307759 RepID=UPI0004A6C02B|nr:tRNA (5-methylaminomethyl-2-thiouridylate)-methyltransferase [Desulfohalovibrio reitneri]